MPGTSTTSTSKDDKDTKDTKPAAKEAPTQGSKTQSVRVGGHTVNLSVDEEVKSDEELEKERDELAKKAQEAERERRIEQAKIVVQDAKTRLEMAEAELDEAEGKGKGPSLKGGQSTLAEGDDLKEHQIAHGQAPVQPGEAEPVELADAAAAKTNRGRGLGG